ncbi:unnamed protein product [Protopolystoma xenopodis]|uniref:Uncharacterized protein n=1 Tax=Protopolystoma xenopodis TaxID=117903 RepID=A0A448XRE6_9PLAT|nr:unnamed protein product [Protopolystoma xenopodis]
MYRFCVFCLESHVLEWPNTTGAMSSRAQLACDQCSNPRAKYHLHCWPSNLRGNAFLSLFLFGLIAFRYTIHINTNPKLASRCQAARRDGGTVVPVGGVEVGCCSTGRQFRRITLKPEMPYQTIVSTLFVATFYEGSKPATRFVDLNQTGRPRV